MAVIYRKTLTGQAKDIKDVAVKKSSLVNSAMVQINQQRNILNAQQGALVAQSNYSLNQLSKNIYQAQKQKTAESAALGLTGAIAQIRDTTQLQTNIANELGSIINEVEQGAMSIAGQQSALNEAEVQTAANEILETYTDTLIEEGNSAISRDWNRQIMNGIIGGITGAIAGGLGVSLGSKGIKKILDPNVGKVATSLWGVGLGTGVGFGAKVISDTVHTIQGKDNEKQNWYDNPFWYGVGGSALGIGASFKKPGRDALKAAAQTAAEGLAKEGIETVATKAGGDAAKMIGGSLLNNTRGTKIGKFAFKSNPWMIAAGAAIGGIIGGIKGGWKARYKLDLEALKQQDTAQQFMDFGLDLDAMVDLVYNK